MRLEEICKKYTVLSDSDIERITRLADSLPMIADLAQANIFIDCPVKEGRHAVVVAEASPRTARSLYERPVAGQYAYESYEPAVSLTHRTGEPIVGNRAITQEGKPVKQSVVPIKNGEGSTIGSLIMEQDISDQLMNEARMRALSNTAEHLSRTLMDRGEQAVFPDIVQEALYLVDQEARVIYTNAQGTSLAAEWGGSGEVVGTPVTEFLPFLDPLPYRNRDVWYQEVNADRKTYAVKGIGIQREYRREGTLFSIRDLTELREKERELMVKSTVIMEIHHRVKNNLQMIASLLRLQMRRGIPEEARVVLQESLNRIISIAFVHEIFSNKGVEAIPVMEMIQRVGNMLAAHSRPDTKINVSYEGEPGVLSSDQAVSLALVANELIQNSVEHAFSLREEGEITIRFSRDEAWMEVQIIDDGTGFDGKPEDSSLGLKIVENLTRHDLGGSFSIHSSLEGTKAVVRFPTEEG
ncbi:sensor histidine kinase [Desmospora profundinema]|uniref:histidine kinase n=1 Tax=Desmospora profundinema TaxID=1571184 RepID=A0ABU1ILI4_9BACL|nr:sensor histidine kinase [Desmospora profundinema]MDR6225427.1 two-component sensor histidine kinase [Desmospora profundinema]